MPAISRVMQDPLSPVNGNLHTRISSSENLQGHIEQQNGQSSPIQALPPRVHRETQYEQARVIFDKTVAGHYRHGKTGYTRVGILFLTWVADDLQCKETEVDSLRGLFATEFKYETHYYEIPSERWQTGLSFKVASFMHEYDSPDCLAIIYYAGHAYEGQETKKFKLSAKAGNEDGGGDFTAFFKDIQNLARAPSCDQLMIMDCCYAARAFTRKHIGKRKFELLTSASHDAKCPAPRLEGSFTQTLNGVLKRLVQSNPTGFSTAHLFRELYHDTPKTNLGHVKPHLFDQSRHNYGKIWLRPQVEVKEPMKEAESTYLTLTLRLNNEPEGGIMNELATHLQFLPHVDHVRFKELYAPREQLANFMRFVNISQKMRPLLRRLLARRKYKKVLEELRLPNSKTRPAPSSKFLELHFAQREHSVHDWSSAERYPKRPYDYEGSDPVIYKKARYPTWPAGEIR